MLSPTQLLRLAGDGRLPADADTWPRASGVRFNTGLLTAGDIFFALPGQSEHGIRYADQALASGASFIVSDQPHERGLLVPDPAGLLLKLGRQARGALDGVIGVTGSAGKTTTKDLLAGLLKARATPGNFNTLLALATTLVDAALHEPNRNLVLELGIDRPGEMQELLELTRPDIGVLTSIAPSHSEFLGSLQEIAAQKRQLLDFAPLRFLSDQAARHLDSLPDGAVIYGLDESAHERAEVRGEPGERQLVFRGEAFPLQQPGSAWATNVTGALAVAHSLGVPAETLRKRLLLTEISPGRLQLRLMGRRLLIDDSYNSNPASAAAALEVLAESAGPRAAILGDMRELGTESRQHHLELGRATVGLDLVIFVGDYAADMQAGNPAALTAANVAEAVPLLDRLPTAGTVLVKASRSLGFENIINILEADQ